MLRTATISQPTLTSSQQKLNCDMFLTLSIKIILSNEA